MEVPVEVAKSVWFDPSLIPWQLVQEVSLEQFKSLEPALRFPRWVSPEAPPKILAKAAELECPLCLGTGVHAHGVDCRACKGTGVRLGMPRARLSGDIAKAVAFLEQFAKGNATIELLLKGGVERARAGSEGIAARFQALWSRDGYRPAGREIRLRDGTLVADSALGAYVTTDGTSASGVIRRIEAAAPAVLAKKGPVLVDRVWLVGSEDDKIVLTAADERGDRIARQMGEEVREAAQALAERAAWSAGFGGRPVVVEEPPAEEPPAEKKTTRRRSKKRAEVEADTEN